MGSSSTYPSRWYLIEGKTEGNSFRVIAILGETTPGRFWKIAKDKYICEMKSRVTIAKARQKEK